jgi:hypothetical protein
MTVFILPRSFEISNSLEASFTALYAIILYHILSHGNYYIWKETDIVLISLVKNW